MKLISIDKLKAIIWHWYERKHLETFKFPKSISITELVELIESTPTVKAIPIEWIRKWHGIDDIRECDLREYVKCTMLYMIKDWEKENGTEESNRNIGI